MSVIVAHDFTSMQTKKLLAFRHPPVSFSGLCYGRLDCEVIITASMVEDVCAQLSAPPDVVWSSNLVRCEVLAKAVSVKLGAALRIDQRLLEMSFGRWEGRTWIDIEAEEPEMLETWYRTWEHRGTPGGESALQLEERVRSWWLSLNANQTHMLIAHAGVIRALRVIAEGISWSESMNREVPHLKLQIIGHA